MLQRMLIWLTGSTIDFRNQFSVMAANFLIQQLLAFKMSFTLESSKAVKSEYWIQLNQLGKVSVMSCRGCHRKGLRLWLADPNTPDRIGLVPKGANHQSLASINH